MTITLSKSERHFPVFTVLVFLALELDMFSKEHSFVAVVHLQQSIMNMTLEILNFSSSESSKATIMAWEVNIFKCSFYRP